MEKNSAGQRFYPSLHVASQAGLDEQNSVGQGVSDYRKQFAFSVKEKSLLIATQNVLQYDLASDSKA